MCRRWFDGRSLLTAVLFSLPIWLAGCGGDGSPSGPADGSPEPAVTVSVSPAAVTLDAGATQSFTATVTGAASTAVTWQASGGTITGTGATVTYTAPVGAGGYAVTATSVADPTKSATATVTVRQVRVTVDPETAEVEPGGTVRLSASITGSADPRVTWASTCGVLDVDGVTAILTAPEAEGACLVTVASVLAPQAKATAVVVVLREAPSLEIAVSGRLERWLTVELAVTRDGAPVPPAAVTWSATPAGAASFPAPGRATFLEAGAIVLRAEVDGASVTRAVAVAVPPAIVFDMVVDGNRDIYRATLDGRDVVRLTTDGLDDTAPTAAAGRVVYVGRRSVTSGGSTVTLQDLYSVPVDGGSPTRLTNTAADESAPALSNDGQRLAFVRQVGEEDRLWIAAGNAADAVRATNVVGFGFVLENAPGWAPDGERLVYSSTHEGSMKVYVLDTRTGAITRLAGEPTRSFFNPAWSPDGEWVAYVAESPDSGSLDVYRIRVATGEVERLTDGSANEIQPDWLADGRLVFTELSGNRSRLRWLDPAHPGEVHDIPLPGENPRNPAAVR